MYLESKKSPYRNKHYQKLHHDKQQIVNQLLYVFTYYCGKNSKYSYQELNEKYFMRLLNDLWCTSGKSHQLIRNSTLWLNLQNIYYSVGRKLQMEFEQFLKIIPHLSVYFQPEMDHQDAMKTFLNSISTLYEKKILFQLRNSVFRQQGVIYPDTREFIMKLSPDLSKIYKIYFVDEINNRFQNKDYHYLSFQAYLELMKDFQIYPKLISASYLFFIYTQNLQNHNKGLLIPSQYSKQVLIEAGQIFKFSKFVESFIILSQVCYHKLQQIDDPETQNYHDLQKKILKVLFQYMQTVKQMKKKKCKFSEHRFSFIIYEEYPQISQMKTYLIKEKIIKQSTDKMGFYDILDKINL